MNIEDQSPATATTEQATIQATVVRDNNVMDLQELIRLIATVANK